MVSTSFCSTARRDPAAAPGSDIPASPRLMRFALALGVAYLAATATSPLWLREQPAPFANAPCVSAAETRYRCGRIAGAPAPVTAPAARPQSQPPR